MRKYKYRQCPNCGGRMGIGSTKCRSCQNAILHEESRAVEINMVRLIADEKALKEIAWLTGLSIRTIEYHWGRVKRLFHVRSYVGATKLAIQKGWITL